MRNRIPVFRVLMAVLMLSCGLAHTSGAEEPPVFSWTDDDLSSTVQVKAQHMTEIKDAVDVAVSFCGVATVWSTSELSILSGIQTGARVALNQLNTLRRGIRTLYTLKSQTPPTTMNNLDSATPVPIQKAFVQDMRDAIEALVQVCASVPPGECGNGAVEAGEECDDSNLESDDGCSSSCELDTATLVGCTAIFQLFDNCCGCFKTSGPVSVATNGGWSPLAGANPNPPIGDQDKAACMQWRMDCP